MINANAYWPDELRYEDYYFIETPWTAYVSTLQTTYDNMSSKEIRYNAYDQEAWAADMTWGALYTESEWPLNIQVITSIMSEADWHYWFGQANVKLSDILKAFSYFPSFCGEVYDADTQDISEVCRQELALFLTYIKYDESQIEWEEEGACYDLSANANEECYGVSDFAQITGLGPTIGDTDGYKNAKTGSPDSFDTLVWTVNYPIAGTPDDLYVNGLGPLPLRSWSDWF